ncbi:ATP-grasp domain-containing protein [Kitasatospora sp. MAP5-34]|uniref:ATP-grasp domain-containing protein n=1 Tax=Kitasatospora sp. MAP5-34 TaxID=3035102 RepID=UPI002473E77A|nr:ATP-grasp domain-containing protein [Kitasatospora sp. MAP5-34]MDH6578575.1 biotin carboxylase [Kitasatospora sp. MAP5-34]
MPGTPSPAAPRVLIVEPTSSAFGLIHEARARGLHTVVASHDQGDRRLPDPVRDSVGTLLQVDCNDEAALGALAAGLHARTPFTGVLSGDEFYVATTARLADRLGLPGLPVRSAAALRDKALMRARVAAAGLRVPRYAEAADAGTLTAAAALVGFPAVLKPAASAGSIHVTRVDDAAGLDRAYRELLHDTRPDDVGGYLDGRVLVEEYLPGPEISVEGYVHQGRAVVVSVTGKILSPEPHFLEIGHIAQAELDDAARERVESYVDAVCRALDVSLGPFHCELRLVGGEPVLVEIGARLPGGRVTVLTEWVTGISLPRIMLAAYTGGDVPSAAVAGAPSAKYAGVHNFTAPGTEVIQAVHGLERVRAAGFVREAVLRARPGDRVPPFGDFRCRLGFAMFTADTHAEALAHQAALAGMVTFA